MSNKRYEISAIIRDKHGRIISTGYNSYVKTHPLQARLAAKVGLDKKCYLHAEVHAILRAGEKIKKAYSIEIFRFDSDGNPKLAKPCKVCQSLISMTPIKHVWYTTEDNGHEI